MLKLKQTKTTTKKKSNCLKEKPALLSSAIGKEKVEQKTKYCGCKDSRKQSMADIVN